MHSDILRTLGIKRSGLTRLFANRADTGWIRAVGNDTYPTLLTMKDNLLSILDIDNLRRVENKFESTYFELPPCLDDFGFCNLIKSIYSGIYTDLLSQWLPDREEIEKIQKKIFSKCVDKFPVEQRCYLYFLISRTSGCDRVVYVGKTYSKNSRGGMRRRFLHHVTSNYSPKTDNYIGDCINKPSVGVQYKAIRLKSSEMRRRGVYEVVWIDLSEQVMKISGSDKYEVCQQQLRLIESDMIRVKHQQLCMNLGRQIAEDPANNG